MKARQQTTLAISRRCSRRWAERTSPGRLTRRKRDRREVRPPAGSAADGRSIGSLRRDSGSFRLPQRKPDNNCTPCTAILVGMLVVAGCGGSSGGSATPHREGDHPQRADILSSVTPPAIQKACTRVAKESPLAVYCPPIVPRGPVRRGGEQGFFGQGQTGTYLLSFRSEVLAQSPHGFARNPYQGHWLVAAAKPAHLVSDGVDPRRRYPGSSGPTQGLVSRSQEIGGVDVTLLSGNTSAAGLASDGHLIAYWRVGKVGFMVSVHDLFRPRPRARTGAYFRVQSRRYLPIVEGIARGLIEQIHNCPRGAGRRARATCDLVFR